MKNRFVKSAALTTIATGLLLSFSASAQETGLNMLNSQSGINTTAGVHLTVPFGGQNSERVQDRARVGLMLNMEREYNSKNFYAPQRIRTNILDFGMQFDGRPTMLMGGQDIYTPLFTPLAANEDGAGSGMASKNTMLIVAGGVLAAGAAVALASGNGNDSDNDDDGRDNDNDGDGAS